MSKKNLPSSILDVLLYLIVVVVCFVCAVVTIFFSVVTLVIIEIGSYVEAGFDGLFKGIFGHRASNGKFYDHKETPEEYRKRKGK